MEKRVKIQSNFEDVIDRKKTILEEKPSTKVDIKLSSGRPKVMQEELRTSYIKIYCTDDEKRKIIAKHGGSTMIRNMLLEESNE